MKHIVVYTVQLKAGLSTPSSRAEEEKARPVMTERPTVRR
jgi:hypothetical protein